MSTFAGAYGAEAGVAALKWIPLGGLYIAGGLTPKNLDLIKGTNTAFMRAFHDKGRLSPLLKRVPVYAVLAEDIGQRGAHLVAFRLLRESLSAEPVTPTDASTILPPMLTKLFSSSKDLAVTKPLPNAGTALVGDIGGTNTRLQLYQLDAGAVQLARGRAPGALIFEQQYLNGDYTSFDEIGRAHV